MHDANAAPRASANVNDLANAIDEVHSVSSAGRYGDALALVVRELSRHPGDCELLFARATVLFDWGRIWEAREGFLEAEANGLSRTALYLNLAWSCALLGLPEEGERHMRTAIAIDPASASAHFGLASILQGAGRSGEAIASYLTALELAPGNALYLTNIGTCKATQQDHVGAEEYARRALSIEPERPQALANLGIALAMQERYDEGLEALQRAADAETALRANGETFVNYGHALMVTGQLRAAAEFHRRNLPSLPDPGVHRQYSIALLTLGNLREGWEQYEFRWYEEPNLSMRPNFAQPPWVGQNLAGKTILLRSEQGAGDIIQFARFAAPLKKMGATVVLQVPDELRELAKGFDGVDQAIVLSMPIPAFDYHISVMSIPSVLGTELSTIPADVPYLRLDSAKKQLWETRIGGGGLKVGLVWAGNPAHLRDRYRSIPFEALDSLWEIPGVRYVSLQKQPRSEDVEKFPPDSTMLDLGPKFEDFGDTAAAIAQLDLIICVDTAVAHLAGALGKPAWVMLSDSGDFRWLLDREDSPWYPTMRLFRQRRLGEWAEVVARVKVALEEAVRTGSLVGPPQAPPATTQLEDSDEGVEAAIEADASTEIPTAISRVAETRYGILQYVPNGGVTARSIAWYGEFLQPQVDLLARMIRPDDRLLEVGSGIGAHAIPLAKMLGPRGHLFLYETRPVLRRILQQNLAAGRVTQTTTLMRRAISGARATPEDGETLDDLLLDRLDLLKIQSDAVADDILEGASDTLWRLRPKLFVSAPDDTSLGDRARQIKAYGYRCWRMESSYFNSGNFYRRDMDIFDGKSGIALLAIPEETDPSFVPDGCEEILGATKRNSSVSTAAPVGLSPDAADAPDNWGQRAGLVQSLRKFLRLGRSTNPEGASGTGTVAKNVSQALANDIPLAEVSHHEAADHRGVASETSQATPRAQLEGPETSRTRGDALFAAGRFREARELLERLASRDRTDGNLMVRLGRAWLESGNARAAEEWMRKAIAIDPDDADAQFGTASALAAQGRLDEADAYYMRAIGLRVDDIDFLFRAAVCKLDRGDPASAERILRQAVTQDPTHPGAWEMLGLSLQRQSRASEALPAFESATLYDTVDRDYGLAFVNFAINLAEGGRCDDAFQVFNSWLPVSSDPYGFFIASLELLRQGEFLRGWDWYEFRLMTPRFLARRISYGRPQWNGQDVRGRTVLLQSEQGLGDTIQFIRFAAILKSMGARVVLHTHAEIATLMKDANGIDHVLAPDEPLPPFEFHSLLLSLPRALALEVTQIPADVPYLRCDPNRATYWAQRMAPHSGVRVGLVWSGNPSHERDRQRSLPLRALEPLTAVDGAKLFSLQKFGDATRGDRLPVEWQVIDLAPDLADFRDTAALLSALDVVVCVDTAIAHLAGALGRPTWLLIPHRADFRWLEDRDDTPWYPTMRLFRQRAPGDWAEVMVRVADALAEEVRANKASQIPRLPVQRTTPRYGLPSNATRLEHFRSRPTEFAAIAETRAGIMQYLPAEPLEGDSLGWCGEWLQAQIDLLNGVLRAGDIVVEIGSGVGAHALAIGRLLGNDGHLIAIETRRIARRILRLNLQANRLFNVTVLDGTATATPILDELQLERLSLLKLVAGVDVPALLDQNAETLWRLRPTILATVADEAMLEAAAACAAHFGYRCWRLETPVFADSNFNCRDQDIFGGRTVLAMFATPEEDEWHLIPSGCAEIRPEVESGR